MYQSLQEKKVKTFEGENIVSEFARKQDHLRMNVAPDQTITLGQQIFLDHRSLSSIDQKIILGPQIFLDHRSLSSIGDLTPRIQGGQIDTKSL